MLVIRVTWVRLLVYELVVELSFKFLDVIVLLNVIMSSVINHLITVFVAIILVLLLNVHSRASPELTLLSGCTCILSRTDHITLRVVRFSVILLLIMLVFLSDVHMASLLARVLRLSSVASLLLGVARRSLLLAIVKLVADAIVRHA